MTYPEILQFFNDKVYPKRISVQKSLIKVAIYEIYSMKWGPSRPLNLRLVGHDPLDPPRDAYGYIYVCTTRIFLLVSKLESEFYMDIINVKMINTML